jgi:hypothetical protein
VDSLIEQTETAANSYSEMAESVSQLTQLKFQSVEELNNICGEASKALQHSNVAKKTEQDSQIRKLKEPMKDILDMIIAA